MNKYKIHFVCRGNVYRSRLAEACAKAIKNERIIATSSGISALVDNPGIQLSSYAKFAASKANFVYKLSRHKVQTTNNLLAAADIVVFMNQDIYRDAQLHFVLNPASCLVWDIDDMGERLAMSGESLQDLSGVHRVANDTLNLIKTKVEQLITEITSISWADIVDENNQELGYRLPISWAADKGLWRRGCHAIILTTDNKYIVEKRSKSIVFNPSRLDVTIGGGVDDGETPEIAIIREINEELGLKVTASMLTLLEVHKWSSYHPHYRKYTRSFLYTYCIKLDSPHPRIKMQTSEVADVRFLTAKQMKRLLRLHRIIKFGRLNSGFKYYERVIKLANAHQVGKNNLQ